MRMIPIFLMAALSACVAKPPEIKFSKANTGYIGECQAGYWSEWTLGTGGNNTEALCQKAAQDYCAKMGKPFRYIDSQHQNTQAYTPSMAQVFFKCPTAADDQRERQKADDELRKNVAENRKTCKEVFGFKEDTSEMSNCLLEIQKERAADARAVATNQAAKEQAKQLSDKMDREQGLAMERSVYKNIGDTASKSYVPQSINCQTYGNTTTCR